MVNIPVLNRSPVGFRDANSDRREIPLSQRYFDSDDINATSWEPYPTYGRSPISERAAISYGSAIAPNGRRVISKNQQSPCMRASQLGGNGVPRCYVGQKLSKPNLTRVPSKYSSVKSWRIARLNKDSHEA
jgi:hypothetical protein